MNECNHAITIKLHQLECTKCAIDNSLCEDNKNCYYKQLQRVTQAFKEITELCKKTTKNVKKYGFERNYTYKAIVQHNNKILKVIKEAQNEEQ